MDNFVLGIDSLLNNLSLTIKAAARLPIFWGFFIGFSIATLVHGFIISENPKKVHVMLFNDESTGFEKLHKQNSDNTYSDSFSTYSEIAKQTKFIFSLTLLLFLLIILLALIIF